MGKRGANNKTSNLAVGSLLSITLSEEASGKRQTSISAKSMLKLEHIRNLALWTGGEASILPLGAFFGHRLGDLGEALGSKSDPSLFICEKCESMLQPGLNCTVRIQRTLKTRNRWKKINDFPQNYVVYNCHFCLHRSLKRGTPRGHMKMISPPNTEVGQESVPSSSSSSKSLKLLPGAAGTAVAKRADGVTSPGLTTDDPSTPSVRTGMTLVEARSKKRNRSKKRVVRSPSDSAKIGEEKSISTSNRRKRKSWTSLEELAQSSGNDSSLKPANLPVSHMKACSSIRSLGWFGKS